MTMIDILMWLFFFIIAFGTLVTIGLAVMAVDKFVRMVGKWI